MNAQCAKCSKTVYPTEKLSCLDKIWHKGCFKCWECGMTLNMKNYKGYSKLPYCNAHYPQTKHTVVADTPEGRRIAQNTKIQSQIKYHAEFEKGKGHYHPVSEDKELQRLRENQEKISDIAYHDQFEKEKGHCIQIANDPEIERMRKMQETVSLVRYHEEFEKNIKGSKIQVAEDPELARIKHNTQIQSEVEYRGMRGIAAEMEQRRANIGDDGPPQPRAPPGSNFNPMDQPSPYQAKHTGATIFDSNRGRVEPQPARRIGSIDDYDPMNDRYGSTGQGYRPPSSGYQAQEWQETIPEPRAAVDPSSPTLPGDSTMPVFEPEPTSKIEEQKDVAPASVPEPEPVLETYPEPAPPTDEVTQPPPPEDPAPEPPPMRGPLVPINQKLELQMTHMEEPRQQHYPPPQQHQPPPQSYQPPPQSYQPPPQPQQPPPPPSNPMANAVFKAMYDYDAADEDEVSFKDGDTIVDIEIIDEGWMTGTVRRTRQHGMLPANYVERVQ